MNETKAQYLVNFIFGEFVTGTLSDHIKGRIIDKRGKTRQIIIFTNNQQYIKELEFAQPLTEFTMIIKDVYNLDVLDTPTAILVKII